MKGISSVCLVFSMRLSAVPLLLTLPSVSDKSHYLLAYQVRHLLRSRDSFILDTQTNGTRARACVFLCVCVCTISTIQIRLTYLGKVYKSWKRSHNDQANIWPVYPSMNFCQIRQSWSQYDKYSLGS